MMDDSLDELARSCFNFYNAWVKAGFSEDQAARMVIVMMMEVQKLNEAKGYNHG